MVRYGAAGPVINIKPGAEPVQHEVAGATLLDITNDIMAMKLSLHDNVVVADIRVCPSNPLEIEGIWHYTTSGVDATYAQGYLKLRLDGAMAEATLDGETVYFTDVRVWMSATDVTRVELDILTHPPLMPDQHTLSGYLTKD